MKVCCIVNDKSGSAEDDSRHRFIELFKKRGVTVDIFKPHQGESIAELAQNAINQNYDTIVAGGGDGTISSVASALIGKPLVRMGILPFGTLNHFARDLKIPTDISLAIDVICDGYVEAIDAGYVNGHYFVNNSSVGLYPAIVKLRESLQAGGYSKWWAAALSSLRILTRFRRLELELKTSDQTVTRQKTVMLFVGNNAYQTSLGNFGTRPSIKNGTLWITVPTLSSRMGLLKSLLNLLFRREQADTALIFETSDLKVTSRYRLMTVANDGEVLRLALPLIYKILPRALNVLVRAPDKE